MVPAGFVQSLAADAREDGQVLTELKAERDKARKDVYAGKGSRLVSSSVGGKSFSSETAMTINEYYTALSQAVRMAENALGSRAYAQL